MFEPSEQQKIFDTVKQQIVDAKADGCNLLIPSLTISPTQDSLFVPALEEVIINTEPGSKDFYQPSNSKNFRLHAVALNRIAIAGELKWSTNDTAYSYDDDGTLIFRAVGGVVNSAGNIHYESGYYPLNLDDLKDDLIDKYSRQAKSKGKDDDWVDYCVNRDFRQKRSFRLQHCETSAKNRVIRKIFNVSNEYTMAQLKKPFLVLKFMIYMDYKDPVVKQMVLAMKVQAALGIYGGSGQALPPGPTQLGIPAPPDMGFNVKDDPNLQAINDEIPIDDEISIDDEPEPEPEEEQGPEETHTKEELDFINADPDTQKATLRELAKRANSTMSEKKLTDNYMDKWLTYYRYFIKLIADNEVPT